MRSTGKPAAKVSPDASMDEILSSHPEAIAVMQRHRMLCVGCLLAPFHDIGDAAREHGIDADDLYSDIMTAIGAEIASKRQS